MSGVDAREGGKQQIVQPVRCAFAIRTVSRRRVGRSVRERAPRPTRSRRALQTAPPSDGNNKRVLARDHLMQQAEPKA